MDFHSLLARMQELDQPMPEASVIEEPNEGNEFSGALKAAKDAGQDEFEVDGKKYKVKEDGTVEACGDMAPMSPMSPKPDTPPPSMSVNMNAQGMDSIEDLLKLITKVNPDMDKPSLPPVPTLGMAPSMPDMKSELPPLKMLPDFDKEDMMNKPDDSDDGVSKAQGDLDNDGDHDMDDHDMEKKKDKEEGFANGTEDDTKPEYKDTDYMLNKLSGGLGRQQNMYKHSYKQGDNPMAMEGEELRTWIKSELQKKLAEAKGVK
jgi:hypothetical protein